MVFNIRRQQIATITLPQLSFFESGLFIRRMSLLSLQENRIAWRGNPNFFFSPPNTTNSLPECPFGVAKMPVLHRKNGRFASQKRHSCQGIGYQLIIYML